MTAYVDLSMPISPDMPTNQPDHFPPVLQPYSHIASDGWAGTAITIDSHCGTHVDAPSHFVAGEIGVDEIPIEVLVGASQRIAVDARVVTPEHLGAVASERVVVHTGWSDRTDTAEYLSGSTHLNADAALHLVGRGVRLVGIDSPSVDAPGCDDVHQILLGHGVIIVENLSNTAALPDHFDLIVSPLRIVGADGSPARVIAVVAEPAP
ncbi:cyclase family protein [Mycobacterium yunnanensis]|uniref:Cyclase family protein n=1 Tax=Mycobacterium yunnanensis TaxID=368477 RepID=A0A9X2Z574_9MYCO|nr:cyclase family protein [Mycobacterium yunnanensis]MCV7423513.1 cyclase family protein [Mycobacterium yunnanensis]